MICDRYATVVVPFPFSDRPASKRRPAVVISNARFNRSGHTTMAMVTTKSHGAWPGDTAIGDIAASGLKTACIVRLKLFTLDNRLIVRVLGALAEHDRTALSAVLRTVLAD